MLLAIQNLIEYLNRNYFNDDKLEEEVITMTKSLYDPEVEKQGIQKGIEQGTQNERIKNIRKLMIKLKMSFKEAIQFLDIPEDEVKEIEKYFKS